MDGGRSALRIRAFEGLLLVFGLLLGVVAAEIALRIYAPRGGVLGETLERRDPYRVLVEPHGFRGYRPRANTTNTYAPGIVATTNAMNYRGPLVAVPKPEGTFRILLLGGSTTHGFGVNDDETIDAHMRALLRERYPCGEFEVVNLGYDGYDSYQLLARLRSDGLAFEPDLIIVNSGINDVRNAGFRDIEDADRRTVLWIHVIDRLEEEERRGRPTLRTRLKHHSFLVRLPGALLFLAGREEGGAVPIRAAAAGRGPDDAEGATHREEGGGSAAGAHSDAVEYFARNLRGIAHEAAAADIPVLFSTPPSAFGLGYVPSRAARRSYWLETPEATEAYRDRLARRLDELVDELRAEGRPVQRVRHSLPPEMFLDDAHLTPAGNRKLAEAFVKVVERVVAPVARPADADASC